MPEVSVVIPTYNRAKLVTRAIDSVLNQTFKNFELIIVDDGSTDNTVATIKKEYSDKRIRLFAQKTNRGGSAGRNIGIEHSKGKYIAFLDSDDEWLPTKLEKQLSVFKSLNLENLGAVGCGWKLIIENNGVIKTKDKIPKKIIGNIHGKLLAGKILSNSPLYPGGTPMIMIKKECFKKIGLFDTKLKASQDSDLYLRLSRIYQFAAVPEVLVKVYIHSGERITDSIDAQIIGKTDFLKKHDKEIPSFSFFRSYLLHHIGIQYMKYGKNRMARRYLFKSVIAYPFKLRYYYHFIRSLF